MPQLRLYEIIALNKNMELKTNEHILQLSGSVNLQEPLEENSTYKIETEIDVVSIIHRNRQDGTKDLIYKGKTNGIVEIIDKKEKKILAKKYNSPSQKMRFAIEIYHENNIDKPNFEFIHHDRDEFYNQTINKIIANLNDIIRLIYK